jgi:ribosome-binding protein aMBF1 (putative translation factor)
MARATWTDMKAQKLPAMTPDERRDYERGHGEARLAAEVGERVRAAREQAGLSQRELAERVGTNRAAIARLEAGGVGARLTTLHRVASAVGMALRVELRPSA